MTKSGNEQYLKNEEYKIQSGQKVKLSDFLKRTTIVKVRLNKSELSYLDDFRKIHGCSRAEYIRRAVVENHPPQIQPINVLAWAELSKAAANLNQLSKNVNFGNHLEIKELENVLSGFRNSLIGIKAEA